MFDPKPLLAIVTGRPGSGKSTLARRLAAALGLEVISRDEIREDLASSTEDPARLAYQMFFSNIETQLSQHRSVIAEAAFQHSRWIPKLEPLLPLCDLRLVICQVPVDLALKRMVEREVEDPKRAEFHPIPVLLDHYEPPKINVPTLILDTSSGYQPSLESVLAFLN